MEYDLDLILKDKKALEAPPAKFNAEKADGAFLLRLPKTLLAMLRSILRRMNRMRPQALERFEKPDLAPISGLREVPARPRPQGFAHIGGHRRAA